MANSTTAATIQEGDPFDYAAYIVYVKRRGGQVNDKIRSLCNDYQELVLQYVEDIAPADLPKWLRGVPTIVNMDNMAVVTGTLALQEVERWAAGRPKPIGAAPTPGTTGVSLADSFSGSIAAEEDTSSSGAISQFSSLEDLLQRRGEKPRGRPVPPL